MPGELALATEQGISVDSLFWRYSNSNSGEQEISPQSLGLAAIKGVMIFSVWREAE
jgi:hypothetical protein